MIKLLAPLLASLLLILNGCGATSAAVSPSPAATAVPTPAAIPSATPCAAPPSPTPSPLCFLPDFPDIPDPGALCGAVMTGQTALDGLVCYRYAMPQGSFPSLRADYAALCQSLGYTPEYAFSGSLSLLVQMDTNAVLLACPDADLLVFAGPKETLLSSMD